MISKVRCIDCNFNSAYSPTTAKCPSCNGEWQEALYELDFLDEKYFRKLHNRPFDLWRYFELLPVKSPNPSLILGEGGTPLIHAVNLGTMLGCPSIYIKDERQGPTTSFKDRQAAVTIATLKEAGITEMVAASTGNVAISYSAYAARAGIKLWAFVTSLVPDVKMREIALYGSQVIKITGSYDQAKQVAADFALKRNLFLDRGARTISSIEAMKTIAFEICEQLSIGNLEVNKSNTTCLFNRPNWYIQAVSGGMGPLGVYKGFKEFHQAGLIDGIPAMGIIQAEGCAPMVQAWKLGQAIVTPVVSPRTYIETLATGNPGRAYQFLRTDVNESGGVFESVSDEETFRAMHILAKMEGISAEPAAAAAFAGLFKLIKEGKIKSTDTIVVNCTGHTVPAEEFILGNDWATNVEIPESIQKSTPEEGLLSALNSIAPEKFPIIAIADDNPDARQLIRRILQSQGNFEIIEAENGRETLEIVRRKIPNLLILDLMMPEIDGFGVLEVLKKDHNFSKIPILVSTAKELTTDEKLRLKGQIQVLLQKGDFLSDDFLDEVMSLIK